VRYAVVVMEAYYLSHGVNPMRYAVKIEGPDLFVIGLE